MFYYAALQHQHDSDLNKHMTKTIYEQVWWSSRTTHMAALEPLNNADTGSYESEIVPNVNK